MSATIVPLLVDARPAYLTRPGSPPSLLLTPAGTGTVLATLRTKIAAATPEPVCIVSPPLMLPDYAEQVGQDGDAGLAVVPREQLAAWLVRHEPSDWLLIVDARYVPVQAGELARLAAGVGRERSVRHLVAMEAAGQGTKEYVQLDESGRVWRIQRYYDGVTCLHGHTVAAALVPVSALRELARRVLSDLAALRRVLIEAGVVTRDRGLADLFDLTRESGLLKLNEHLLRGLERRGPALGYLAPAPGVWVAAGSVVDPTARLVGPVIVHADVRLEANVTVVGPAVIGAGSQVRRGAIVAHSVIAAGTCLPENSATYHRLRGAGAPDDGEEPAHASDELTAAARGDRRLAAPSEDHTANDASYRRRAAYVATKRIVEGVIAALGLVVLSPLLVLTAAAIRATSRGPVFFAHEREGKDGRPFSCWKFRTMVAHAHRQQRALYRQNQVDGPQFKLPRDQRVTWVGRWLRTTNIDELPQLFNVVRGQMSLIGPRPSPFRENQICVPWRQARLSVRPGITGLWQLCRHERSAGDFHQWIYYDTLYVRHLSPIIDLKILLATVLTFGGRFSVPLRWLISTRQLEAAQEFALESAALGLR